RTGETEGLHVDLVELPVAALLRALVTEHRSRAPQPLHLVVEQSVGETRAHHAGGGFGTQRQALLTAVEEGVHLLLDDVGGVADGALEQFRLLHHRQADLTVTVALQHLAGDALQLLPAARGLRQYVVHAPYGLDELRHKVEVPSLFTAAWPRCRA